MARNRTKQIQESVQKGKSANTCCEFSESLSIHVGLIGGVDMNTVIGLVESALWTEQVVTCESDSWQCRIHIPCSHRV